MPEGMYHNPADVNWVKTFTYTLLPLSDSFFQVALCKLFPTFFGRPCQVLALQCPEVRLRTVLHMATRSLVDHHIVGLG